MDTKEFERLSGVERVDALNKSAWELRVSDSLTAHARSREAVVCARQLGYVPGLAAGLRTLGFTFIRLARYAESAQALEEAARLFSELGDLDGQADVCEYLGIVQRSHSNYAASIELLLRSLHYRETTQNAEGVALSLYHTGVTYKYAGDYQRALDYLLRSLDVARGAGIQMAESYALNVVGGIHLENGDYEAALDYYQQSLSIRRQIGDAWGEAGCLDNIGMAYIRLGRFDEACDYCQRALDIAGGVGDGKGKGNALFNLSRIAFELKQYPAALAHAAESLSIRQALGDKKAQGEVLLFLGEIYGNPAFPDHSVERALAYLGQALELDRSTGATDLAYRVHLALSQALKSAGRYEEALAHFEIYHRTEKEVHSEAFNRRILGLKMEHEVERAQKEAELVRLRNVELAELVDRVHAQRDEIEAKNVELNEMLAYLRNAQAQLVHQEKMASLGALTAGIAHEIKNPLNFINNFALNAIEMAEEIAAKAAADPELHVIHVQDLLNDLMVNARKIAEHGRRADGIVRSMLGHSRTAKGERQPTNVNALLEEYVTLAYHGARAQWPDFEVQIERDYDPAVGKLELVPQEIGRVFLNLLNNAFYAVAEQRAKLHGPYRPTVAVSTRWPGGQVEIRVKDNGPGIPETSREKIFEPFFTTKPTGQGAGLGLSLSHDIVVQGHGGTMTVESEEGAGATFLVVLPDRQPLA